MRLAHAYALFEYLSVGLDAAVAVHERLLAMLQPVPQPASTTTGGGGGGSGGGAAVPSTPPQPLLSGAGSAQHEALLEHHAWLLHRHAATHPTPPARLRSLLERGLAAFPANSTLLGLLVGGRASAHRRFAVRRLLSGLRRAHPSCPQLWVASVALELNDAAPPAAAYDHDGSGTELASDEGNSSDDARRGEREPLRPPGHARTRHVACKACQAAKVSTLSCADGQRPCGRCLRLGIPCEGDARVIKRACVVCRDSKVKCDIDDNFGQPCTRCQRLGTPCVPHVPSKRKRPVQQGRGAAAALDVSSLPVPAVPGLPVPAVPGLPVPGLPVVAG